MIGSRRTEPSVSTEPGAPEDLATWADVDRALEAMGRETLEIKVLEAALGEEINAALTRHREALEGARERYATLEERVSTYCIRHKGEFAKKRSKQLTFGGLAFRTAERVEIPEGGEETAIDVLKALGHEGLITVVEKIDKSALKHLDDLTLLQAGIRRHREDRVRVEPNLPLIAERAGPAYGGIDLAPGGAKKKDSGLDLSKIEAGLGKTAGGAKEAA